MGAVAVASPEIREKAQEFFRSEKLPRGFEWVEYLSPLHLRLFVVDLHKALANALIHEGDSETLVQVIEDWKATAEVDADPELSQRLKMPREKKRYREWKPEG